LQFYFQAREQSLEISSLQIKAVCIHDSRPSSDEITDEFVVRVRRSINFGKGAQNGVGAEDEIIARASPFNFTSLSVAALEDVFVLRNGSPFCGNVKNVDKEVVGQDARTLGEDAVRGCAEGVVENTQTTNQDGHLGRRESKQLSFVDEESLSRDGKLSFLVIAEAVGKRLEVAERMDVRLLLGGIHAAGCERHGDVDSGGFGSLLDTDSTSKNNEVSE